MDDSFEDFQEIKKRCRGSKLNSKKPHQKNKVKNDGKKIKGQKDIRSALRTKNSDLLSYCKEFQQVCEQTGVDVNAEQLQLAIAMSKSLQEAQNNVVETNNSTGTSNILSTQERCNKMKATLLEYGFHVPNIKIDIMSNKKRACMKKSKLLHISEDERHQIICDKYSQILFNSGNNNLKGCCNHVDNKKGVLYNLCTNQSYEVLKNNDVFYVKDLFEPSYSKITALLRDWSEIPGRPVSPPCKESLDLSFHEVIYTPDELDFILSGRLNEAKKIIASKQKLCTQELKFEQDSDQNKINNSQNATTVLDNENKNTENINSKESSNIRSISPDIFDDEISELMENTKETSILNIYTINKDISESNEIKVLDVPSTQTTGSQCTRKNSNDFMDLTECVNNLKEIEYNKPEKNIYTDCRDGSVLIKFNCNLKTNFTKNKSNDFMDLTECVRSTNSNIKVFEEHIDLTQVAPDNIKIVNNNFEDEFMDLTQSSDSNDITLPYVVIDGVKPIVGEPLIEEGKDTEAQTLDVSVNKSIIDNVALNRSSSVTSLFDDYEYCHSDHSSEKSNKSKNSLINNLDESTKKFDGDNMDQKQNTIVIDDENENKNNVCQETVVLENENMFKYISKLELKEQDSISCVTDVINKDPIEYDDVPLTQLLVNGISNKCTNVSKLGKMNNESVDYGEIYDNIQKSNKTSFNSTYKSNMNELLDIDKSITKLTKHCSDVSSQCSDVVFEISDEELDYSMNRTKCDKGNSFKDVSDVDIPAHDFIYDEIVNCKNTANDNLIKRNSRYSSNRIMGRRSLSDSSLPFVEIKGTNLKIKSPDKISKSQNVTPMKKSIGVSVKTPKNSDYVIKTNNVTPMLNYTSLTTPEMHKELNKYGIKPFKRKRGQFSSKAM